MTNRIIGIIPTRLNSSRFPGKLLVPIFGKSLLQRTYENALQATSLTDLIVATYDQQIYDHVKSFGGKVVMTDSNCVAGSDCIAAALERYPELRNFDVVVNIQGDEPCLDPACIDEVSQILIKDRSIKMSTLVTPLTSEEDARSSSIVKCVMDQQLNALYFTRAKIPSNKKQAFNPNTPYYRHIGLYAFCPDFLLEYKRMPTTPLQMEEDLEQLKVLEHGYRIRVAIVNHGSIGVDTPEDIKKVEQWLCKQNTFL